MSTLVWFRHNLRLTDNPALLAALAFGQPIVPVYVWDDTFPMGGASRWWLYHSLKALNDSLEKTGNRLTVVKGPAAATLTDLANAFQATLLVIPVDWDPASRKQQQAVKQQFGKQLPHCALHTTTPNLLCDVTTFKNQQGKPFQVFTPFWKALGRQGVVAQPLPAPFKMPTLTQWPETIANYASLESLGLLPIIPWDKAFYTEWQPGEAGAQKTLQQFLDHGLKGYRERRNLPAVKGTSQLSPYLHFGELSIADVWQQIREWVKTHPDTPQTDVDCFLSELGWREFSHYLLYHFPNTTHQPLRTEFEHFPWQPDDTLLKAWQKGLTGYPIVDAGMRQLWATGWMHNRVRMIVASFLVKHLLQPWQEGAEWFMDTLVDADEAANVFGWQWSAGCGADAAPYFRIFNPVLQGQKFDPKGEYIRRWVPELAGMSDKNIHQPWLSGLSLLNKGYPSPVVDHAEARAKALAAFQALKQYRFAKGAEGHG